MSDEALAPRHVPPRGAATYIADMMAELRVLAIADGHGMLVYLIDMVRTEASALRELERGERHAASRDGLPQPPP